MKSQQGLGVKPHFSLQQKLFKVDYIYRRQKRVCVDPDGTDHDSTHSL